MIKVYTIYLPAHGHEDQPIGTIRYEAMRNCAMLQLHNQPEQQFCSPFAAMDAVRRDYPFAYAD